MGYVEPLEVGHNPVVRLITEMGHGLTIIAIFLILIGFYEEYRVGLAGLSSLAVTGIFVTILKNMLGLSGPHARRLSFPSGHTAAAFAAAIVLARRYPKWRYPFFLLAGAVGISRIFLKKHYPSDVCGGAALGIAVGAATNYVWKRLTVSHGRKRLRQAAFVLIPLILIYGMLGSDVPRYHMKITVPAILFLFIRKAANDWREARFDEQVEQQ